MVDLLGVGLASLAAFGLAGQSLFVRLGTRRGASGDALLVVFGVNLAMIAPVAAVGSYPDYGLVPLGIAAFIGAGVIGTMFGRALLYAGIERVGASRAEPLKASQPLWATIGAVILLGELLTPVHGLGITLIVVGVGLISWENARIRAADTPEIDADLVGLALPLGAAIMFGLEPLFAKFGFAAGTPTMVGLTLKIIAALGSYVAYRLLRGSVPEFPDFEWDVLKWYLAAGVSSSVFLLSYYAALARAPVVLVIPIMQSSPLIVVVLSLLFMQRYERVTIRLAAAAGVVVAGAAIVSVFA